MELKTCNPLGSKFVFEKNKSKVLHYIQLISFANAQVSVKIRLAYFLSSLVII